MLDLEYRDCLRALRRGLGPAKQAQPFDLTAIASLTDEQAKSCGRKGYPAHLREVILVASWWLLRKIELSSVTLRQVSFLPGAGCGIAVLDLPVSKADPMALGKARS